jgi:amino acid transporter
VSKPPRKITLWPLVAATYFMVSGGPYGLEELVAQAGYSHTIAILLLTPIVWSLPTALMVGELAAAIPEEGGYYAWVRRALGPFWGFQEAWLSLVASVFDMAIYPTLFVLYIGRLWPACAQGTCSIALGAAMIAACALVNARGARAVGGASLLMAIALLVPFVALVVLSVARPGAPVPAAQLAPTGGSLLAGVLVAMWNYMGWDNASTIASDVDRPQRTYPLAMLACVTLVAITYVAPVLAAARAGLDPTGWTTGAWATAARVVGGRTLEVAVVAGGVVCGLGMFNALVLSYSRLPVALAQDGFLPSWVAHRSPRTGAPWVAIVLCSVAYAACLGLGFQRLVELDVLCYGLSLLLEFVALFVLRVREPNLARPFAVPGGRAGAALVGLVPMALLVIALVSGRDEHAGSVSALALGGALVAAGPLVWLPSWWRRRREARAVAAPGPLP